MVWEKIFLVKKLSRHYGKTPILLKLSIKTCFESFFLYFLTFRRKLTLFELNLEKITFLDSKWRNLDGGLIEGWIEIHIFGKIIIELELLNRNQWSMIFIKIIEILQFFQLFINHINFLIQNDIYSIYKKKFGLQKMNS